VTLDFGFSELYSKIVQLSAIRLRVCFMAIQATYSAARANLASLLDQVTGNREVVIINRRGEEDVAMVSAAELSSLLETAHLLRSPANARRLLTALRRATAKKLKPQSLARLRQEVGLE
jgi:antitoxin YefM